MNKNFDPYDLGKKQQLHPKADQKNFIEERKGKLVLCCGARKKKKEGFCRSRAGSGTDHLGYGRCKFCGGNNKGPITKEGVEKSSQNARKHGLYARHLNEKEQETFEELKQKKATLKEEISLLQTKLDGYYEYVAQLEERLGEEGIIKYRYKRGIGTAFRMGTIEDPYVHQTVEQIRRLVATTNAIDPASGESLVDSINAELRAANQKEVKASWGAREPQWRVKP